MLKLILNKQKKTFLKEQTKTRKSALKSHSIHPIKKKEKIQNVV